MSSKKEKDFFHDDDVVEDQGFFNSEDLSDQDRANIFEASGGNTPDVGALEALGAGAEQGVSLGLSDELAGAAAATGYASGKTPNERRTNPKTGMSYEVSPLEQMLMGKSTASKDELLAAYQEARNAERERQKTIQETRPGMHFAGSLVGGALLPGMGAGNLANQGLKQAVVQGAKVGSGAGLIAGIGGSEADLTQMTPETSPQILGELGIDAGVGLATGGFTGAAVPVASATVQGVGSLGKKLGDKAMELPFIRDPMTALKAGLEGRLISTEAGRRDLAESVRNASKGLLGDIRNIKGQLSSQYETLLSKLEKDGVNIESKEILEGALQELDQIKSNPKIDDVTLREANELQSMFQNYLSGRPNEAGVRPGVNTKMTPAEAKQTVTKLRDKVNNEQLKERETSDVARDAAGQIDKQVNQIPGIEQLDTKYRNLNDVIERLKLDLKGRTDSVNLDKLTSVFTDIEKQQKSGDKAVAIINEIFPKLEEIQPGITTKYKPSLEKLAKDLEVNQQARRPIYGRPIQGAAYAGYATRKLSDAVSKASSDLMQSTPQQLQQQVAKFYAIGSRSAKELGNVLSKLEGRDVRKRQALIFGLMQNPEYRALLGVKENQDESGSEQ